ncbi:hypothetical protein [Streptomyces lydicus]|uniref:hypothetical protein n=1 Tax=Streptomyces lydicus TaxID=47763 RepID=UPI0036E21446
MALRIFDTDPDAKPAPKKEFTKPEYAFQFRSGMMKGKKPVSLAHWRVLTGSEDVAQGISELMGGTPTEFDPSKEFNLEVMTDTSSVLIVIDGSKAIEDKLILWGRSGPIHECDGITSLLPEDKGEPCGCPPSLNERKTLAKAERGPSPNITVAFRFAGAGNDLGLGKYTATAWTFAESLYLVQDALDQIEGEALCRLELERVEFTSDKYGAVSYTKPVITVLGSYNDAIAEER